MWQTFDVRVNMANNLCDNQNNQECSFKPVQNEGRFITTASDIEWVIQISEICNNRDFNTNLIGTN